MRTNDWNANLKKWATNTNNEFSLKEIQKETKQMMKDYHIPTSSRTFAKKMDVANIEDKFNKALRMLDLEREDRALDILNEIITKTQKEKDALFFIRASCVLGELFFQKGETEKAQQYLLNVISTPYEKNDVVDYEKAVAASILHQIG